MSFTPTLLKNLPSSGLSSSISFSIFVTLPSPQLSAVLGELIQTCTGQANILPWSLYLRFLSLYQLWPEWTQQFILYSTFSHPMSVGYPSKFVPWVFVFVEETSFRKTNSTPFCTEPTLGRRGSVCPHLSSVESWCLHLVPSRPSLSLLVLWQVCAALAYCLQYAC